LSERLDATGDRGEKKELTVPLEFDWIAGKTKIQFSVGR